jgi:Predicted ATPase
MIGRDKELRTLRRLLADAAAGHGSAMLIHGAAGVGKSALLRTVGAEAIESGFKVLRTSGVEPEQWLPFAALQMLLQPVAHGMKDLSAPHRSALSGAFGVRDTEPEIYRVGLAVLELLADEANQQPLLLLVDDLQWIDSSSRDVLKFVARRTNDLAIQVIAAARIQYSESYVLLDIPLQPLSRPAAAELLDVGAPDLLASLRALILERAAGNPLALVELPKAVQGVTAQMDDLPLTQRLEDAFSARSDSVSRECRTLLLVLAAEPSAPLNLLLELSSRISGSAVSVDAVQEAVDADLVTLVGYTPSFAIH